QRLLDDACAGAPAQVPGTEPDQRNPGTVSFNNVRIRGGHDLTLMNSPVNSLAFCSPALGVGQESQKEQGPARGLASAPERRHARGHRALEIVPIERAGPIARVDPGPLHVAQLDLLIVVELVAQPAEALVEDVVPDRKLTVGAADLAGGRFRPRALGTGIGDDADAALLLLRPAAGGLDARLDRRGIARIGL